jgi:hypothetical protein
MEINDIIEKLGGAKETARLFNVGASAISNWRAAGSFPAHLHYRIDQEAKRRGFEIPAAFFLGESAA